MRVSIANRFLAWQAMRKVIWGAINLEAREQTTKLREVVNDFADQLITRLLNLSSPAPRDEVRLVIEKEMEAFDRRLQRIAKVPLWALDKVSDELFDLVWETGESTPVESFRGRDALALTAVVPEFCEPNEVAAAMVDLISALNDMHVSLGGSGLYIDKGQSSASTVLAAGVPR